MRGSGAVPGDVPVLDASTSRGTEPARKRRNQRSAAPRYLTKTESGWRFQMRLPLLPRFKGPDSDLPSTRFMLRASLGERTRREAERTAQRLATLCRAICSLVNPEGRLMSLGEITPAEADLVASVVAACQEAINRALLAPSEAIGLASGLQGALATLMLVGAEHGKGDAGAKAVVDNAEALTRGALEATLRLATNPSAGLAALSAVPEVVPVRARSADPRQTVQEEASRMPTFGHVSQAYIDTRIMADTAEHAEIKYLRLRRQTFLDLIGDKPVDKYYPKDLQKYVNEMQFWPANATKRSALQSMGTREIIEANRGREQKPLALKTLQDGYVANVRTMMRFGMQNHRYYDPFANANIIWPKTLSASVPREGVDRAVLNRAFAKGVASGRLDEAILPLLAALTTRRLALLLFIKGEDIRHKHGVYIAQVSDMAQINGRWTRVPIKTNESKSFFVLHNFLDEIGFIAWARARQGFLFEEAHRHTDPAKYMSKVMNRLLQRSGAAGRNSEVFHSLRGDGIQLMRDDEVQPRTVRMQAGHELGDTHNRYGSKSLQEQDCVRLATLPLPKGIDWSVFKGLDFDVLAAKRRTRGRAPRSP